MLAADKEEVHTAARSADRLSKFLFHCRTVVITLLADDTGLSAADSLRYTGFQYVSWQFEDEDLICVIRTA